MRRAFSVLAAFVLAAAVAAPASAQGLRIGAEGGVNFANVSSDPDAETDALTGFRGGLSVEYGFGDDGAFALKTGAFYSQKGTTLPAAVAAVVFEDPTITFDVELAADYIEIPVVGLYNIPVEGSFTPRVLAGGLVGIEASCEVSGGGQSADCDDPLVGFETASLDLGLLFGGGFGYAISDNATLTVDGRYNLGVSDLNETPNDPTTVKNRVFQVNAGVVFAL